MPTAYAKQAARAILYGWSKDDTYFYKTFTNGVYRILLTDFEKLNETTTSANWVQVVAFS